MEVLVHELPYVAFLCSLGVHALFLAVDHPLVEAGASGLQRCRLPLPLEEGAVLVVEFLVDSRKDFRILVGVVTARHSTRCAGSHRRSRSCSSRNSSAVRGARELG